MPGWACIRSHSRTAPTTTVDFLAPGLAGVVGKKLVNRVGEAHVGWSYYALHCSNLCPGHRSASAGYRTAQAWRSAGFSGKSARECPVDHQTGRACPAPPVLPLLFRFSPACWRYGTGMNPGFHHTLTWSAVAGLARAAERQHAHGQLAAALPDDPERRAWHLANAVVRPDEEVAASLEEAAYRLRRRGDPVGAVTALTKAAELSPTDASRARRLADAAYAGAGMARGLAAVPGILRAAQRADPDSSRSLEAAVATAFVLLNTDGTSIPVTGSWSGRSRRPGRRRRPPWR